MACEVVLRLRFEDDQPEPGWLQELEYDLDCVAELLEEEDEL